MNCLKIILIIVLALAVAGCDFFRDSTPNPWIGYAYDRNAGRFAWELNDWATARDCKEAMLYVVQTRPSMAEPVGCGYRGNNYMRVWIMNAIWGGNQIECIIKMTSSIETKGGTAYNLKLKGSSERRGDTWYCV